MKQKRGWIFKWLAALLITVLALASLAGCRQGDSAVLIGTKKQEGTAAAAVRQAETGTEETAGTSVSGTDLQQELSVEEDGTYTSKEEVALYLHIYGKLPSNFITKKEAESLGWKKKQGHAGDLDVVAPGKSIGGSHFGNYEGQLPEKEGRKYYECDVNYQGESRGAERIIYSDDGLIYYTGDHYKTFEQLYPEEL